MVFSYPKIARPADTSKPTARHTVDANRVRKSKEMQRVAFNFETNKKITTNPSGICREGVGRRASMKG